MDLGDDALRSRLLSLGHDPPPITDSTRGVLRKKLAELERTRKSAAGVPGANNATATAKGRRTSAAASSSMPRRTSRSSAAGGSSRAAQQNRLLEYR